MPPSIAMVIDMESDNKARTFQDVRTIIKKGGGTVSPTAYLFTKRGRVVFEKDVEKMIGVDEVFDYAIENGAEDIEEDDGNLIVWTEPADTMKAAKALAAEYKLKIEDTEVIWDANQDTMVAVDSEETVDQLVDLVTKLQYDPAVNAIYANCTKGAVSDEKWEELQDKIPV